MADIIDHIVHRTSVNGTPFTSTYLYPDGDDQIGQVHARDDIDPESPKDCVIMCHGRPGDENTFSKSGHAQVLLHGFMDHGRYVCCESRAGLKNFGNQAALDSYRLLYEYVARNYTIENVFVLGQSMGGLSSLNTYKEQLIPNMKGWVGIAPICDMRTWTNLQDLYDAYGVTNEADLAVATVGYNPILEPPGTWLRCFRAYASYEDGTVHRSSNADPFIASLIYAREAAIVACTGDHISTDHYRPDDVLAFFDRARIAEPGTGPLPEIIYQTGRAYYWDGTDWLPVRLLAWDGNVWNLIAPARVIGYE